MQRERACSQLSRALGPSKVATELSTCEAYVTDDSGCHGVVPDAVVFAKTRDDVAATLRIAAETGVPVTPRGAGTGRTGGATTVVGGIVLATAGMGRIIDVDREEGLARVEPGVVLADLHRAVEREGWFYPPDPNSAESCVLGGNVAENAAGPRALKYGATRDYTLGMEVVLMGGQKLELGRRTKKGVTGYDVTALLVGSEGTLAVLGDLTLRLVPKPEQVVTFSIQFSTLSDAARAVSMLIAKGSVPRCAELLDETTLKVMRAAGAPCSERANAMLILEVDGHEAACEREAAHVAECCERVGALEVLVAQSENQRSKLWDARKQMSHAVRRFARHKLSEDVVVPRRRLGELLAGVRAIGERFEVKTLSYGHAGDGNMHVNFLWDTEDEAVRVQGAIEQLFRLTLSLDGTLSGEHGIGILKAPYLHLEQSAELIELQRKLKATFDPAGLLNPGKIFASGHRAC